MAIPKDRPVCGSDLEDLRMALGASATDMSFIVGASMVKWTQLIRTGHHPIDNPTVEIITRFLDANLRAAEEMPLLNQIDGNEVFEEVNRLAGPVEKKQFAVSLGRQATSGYRWTVQGGQASAALKRALWLYRWNLMQADAKASCQQRLIGWETMVREVGRAHGINDVFKRGYWSKARAKRDRASFKADQDV